MEADDQQRAVPRRRRVVATARNIPVLAIRTARDSLRDRLPRLAAELAFYMVLSLPPFLLVLLGLLGYLETFAGADTVASLQEEILEAARTFLTESTVADVVEPALDSLLEKGRADILSVSALFGLWSASRATRVIIEVVTIAYDLEDHRPWWKRALLALAMTAAGVLAVTILLPLLVIGPEGGAAFASKIGLARAFEIAWRILHWPVVALVGVSLLAWVYHIARPRAIAWKREVPGALLALVVWVLGSWGLRVYAVSFIESESAYSVFAAPLVVLLWVYISAAALLVGAEFNAEIEKMWPAGEIEAAAPTIEAVQAAASPTTTPTPEANPGPESD